jgi:hypothetical protein
MYSEGYALVVGGVSKRVNHSRKSFANPWHREQRQATSINPINLCGPLGNKMDSICHACTFKNPNGKVRLRPLQIPFCAERIIARKSLFAYLGSNNRLFSISWHVRKVFYPGTGANVVGHDHCCEAEKEY